MRSYEHRNRIAGTARRLLQRRRHRRRTPPGTAPGTLVSDPEASRPILTAIGFGPDQMVEEDHASLETVGALRGRFPVLWVNVDGLGDADLIAKLGDMFGLHGLALEDVLHVVQRPKVEDYEDLLFMVARMPRLGDGGVEHFDSEQLAMFLGADFVITFQERRGDCFDPIRDRIRSRRGRVRQSGPDYLWYALLDAAIDSYFPILERYGEAVEELESAVLADQGGAAIHDIHTLKRDLLSVRRAIWPMRDLLSNLIRDESPFITAQTRIFLRDCYDHGVQLVDMTETDREIAASLVDIHLSMQGNRMNEIMKVLTIIATIFIPLSFVAGLYGMNFDTEASPWNMPELRWSFGYPFALGLMAGIAALLLIYFRRRGWLGRR